MKFTQHYFKCMDCGGISFDVSVCRCTGYLWNLGEPADVITLTCPRCGSSISFPLAFRSDLSEWEDEVREYIPSTRNENDPTNMTHIYARSKMGD
jgi:ribosomal protein L37E